MRIGVNTRFLLPHKMEGFGWYTYETMLRITRQYPEHEFFFFFDRAFDKKFIFSENVTPVVVHPFTRHPILIKIWFDWSIKRALKKYQCEAFISPDGYLSLTTNVPQLSIIHDLNFEHNPQDLPKSSLEFYKKRFPLFAKKAARICTVSHFSKADIVETYGISPEKIDVTHNGVSSLFRIFSEEEKTLTRQAFTDGNPYIIFVGAIHRRKNLQRLLQAFTELKNEQNISEHLLIVGEPMWKSQQIKIDKEIQSVVHFSGHLAPEALMKVMGSATCLAFVSYFEGFGIPILEAMQAGVPVLAGNKTSLPEVGGDAAIYCDPYSVKDIKEKLLQLLTDDQLQKDLIVKGLARSRQFSWDQTAQDLWNAFVKMTSKSQQSNDS